MNRETPVHEGYRRLLIPKMEWDKMQERVKEAEIWSDLTFLNQYGLRSNVEYLNMDHETLQAKQRSCRKLLER